MSEQEHDKSISNQEGFDAKKLEGLGQEQQERLKEDVERSVEAKPKENLDEARHEALEHASRAELEKITTEKSQYETAPDKRRGPPGKAELNASFNSTIKEVRSQMSGPSRAFSVVIHNPVIEKVSDVVAATVARPNAILSGAVFAFLITTAIYLIARFNGYYLTGTETIASFILGWLVGLIYDYIRLLVLGKR